MEAFPFTRAEWATVGDAALPVVNAMLAGDPVLRASHLIGLQEVLAGLRARYGDHPVLLETEADFADDDRDRITLYRQAATTAAANRLPTLSILLSLARAMLNTARPDEAAAELAACEQELPGGDDMDRDEWAALAAEAGLRR